MEASKAEPLEGAVATLDRLIALTQQCGLRESTQFLAMARTQLLIELNGITDAEFRALCDWLDGKQPQPRPDETARTRRDGSLRSMRRAWQCPDDNTAGRGRRRAAAAG